MRVMAVTLFQTALALSAVLFLSTTVQADTTGCAPANEVTVALAKAQDIASQELVAGKGRTSIDKTRKGCDNQR